MKWHLHVTVQPHWSWTLSDVTSALKRDIERHEMKPLVITNHFRDPARPSYKELIPSKVVEADDEATASRMIFHMGVLLNNAGWRVKRLKIEGDARSPSVQRRAMYFECHLKNPQIPLEAPKSTSAKDNVFYTVRRDTLLDVQLAIAFWSDVDTYPEIEAAVLDTNPALDADWINQ